jgi:hypothetical protein
MEDGAIYTLLIDRFKKGTRKGANGTYRKSKYYHERVNHATANGRLSEVRITSTNGQLFNFKQDNYFSNTGEPTGISNKNNRSFTAYKRFVNLGFRIRIEKDGHIIETPILGSIAMNINKPDGSIGPLHIGYAKPNS